MISTSQAYQAAITGDSRRVLLKAVVDITDPDITFSDGIGSGAASFSKPEQLHDKEMSLNSRYATLEPNRWVLDGSFRLIPDDPAKLTGEVGFVGDVLSGEDGRFESPVWAELTFSNVSILQAFSVYFSDDAIDGIAEDFSVVVYSGDAAVYTKDFTGNTAISVSLDGFTVYDPTSIRVTVTKWSLPRRRIRIAEIIPGIYEEWDSSIIAAFSVVQRANFACLALPYGTCTLKMDNLDRRFEPRSKAGVFQSIEDRQGIDVSIGVQTEAGDQYIHVGKFYQYSGGWRTGDNGLSMQWDLVDIVGLLADRQFLPPDTLPTTLGGWAAALVAQLGANFEGLYTVDPDYANIALTASLADVTGKKCGELIRFACMATGTWPRADAETGYLTFEPFWEQGNKLTLDNLVSYPVMKANDDLAAIIFTLNDGSNTQYVVSGNSTASSNTVSVSNPFIKTTAQALTAAKMILSTYGGNKLETTGRGDPSGEIGDVDTVWLNESSATTGRRQSQSFQFQNGVMQNCQSTFLQADGSFLFQNRVVLTGSGQWTAPAGVTKLRLILVGHGGDGTDGTDGSWDAAGVDGIDGTGGKVWSDTVNINDGQIFDFTIGDDATFGPYSSTNGKIYPYGFTDIQSGDSYARSGVASPLPGSGDGGAGGKGGVKGNKHTETRYVTSKVPAARAVSRGISGGGSTGGTTPGGGSSGGSSGGGTVTKPVTVTVIDNYPGPGGKGKTGVIGCVVVYWDKEAT